MDKKLFYRILLDGIKNQSEVTKIVYGYSWTAAGLSDGSLGVAMHTPGDTAPRMFKSLIGMKAADAAEAVMSWNMEEANEAMAVINACYNTTENLERLNAFTPEEYTNSIQGIDLSGKTVGFIGHMVGKHSSITEETLKPAKQYYILDREPKSGDLPDSACEYILPQCDLVVITGSASMNKTMPRLLELSQNAEVVLVGPSVPLCEGIMDLGIKRIHGNVVIQKDELCSSIVEKPGAINHFCRFFTLDK